MTYVLWFIGEFLFLFSAAFLLVVIMYDFITEASMYERCPHCNHRQHTRGYNHITCDKCGTYTRFEDTL